MHTCDQSDRAVNVRKILSSEVRLSEYPSVTSPAGGAGNLSELLNRTARSGCSSAVRSQRHVSASACS
jgi:hypothetical protein